jgi:hypothetical protein
MSGCWLWTGPPDAFGYGKISIRHRMLLAHRVQYEIRVGPIPAGLCILHHCDVPACVNPAHLFLGTRVDNIADMVSKNRQNRSGLRIGNPGPRKKKLLSIARSAR